MNNRTVSSALLIALLYLGITFTSISANDKAPIFVDCPGTLDACHGDSFFVQVKAIHPNSEKAQSIRYFLVDGVGEVDSITGVWSMVCCGLETPYGVNSVVIGASIGKSPNRTFAEQNCTFEFTLLPESIPILVFDGQEKIGVFEIRPHRTLEIPITFAEPLVCGAEITITSVEPYFAGSMTFVNDTTLSLWPSVYDLKKRFTIKVQAKSGFAYGHGLIIADCRVDVPTPEFVICPVDTVVKYPCDISSFFAVAHDPLYHDSLGIQYKLVEGPRLFGADGRWRYPYLPDQAGQSFDFELSAGYLGKWTSGEENCRFTIRIAEEDQFPDFAIFENNPCGDTIQVTANERSLVPVQAVHSNFCNKFTYFIESINPVPEGEIRFHLFRSDDAIANVLLEFAEADIGKTFAIKVGAARYPDTSFCEFYATVGPMVPYEISIERVTRAYQGQTVNLPIMLNQAPFELGGFNLLVKYNTNALILRDVTVGAAISDSGCGCGWKYFTYRTPDNGLIRIVAIAAVNGNPPCFNPPEFPAQIANLKFLITNDRSFECSTMPVQFYWESCGDNILSNRSGDSLFISRDVFDWSADSSIDVTDPEYGYPTIFGAQDFDCTVQGNRIPTRRVDYYNGGVELYCDYIEAKGDINLNEISYEFADAVLFSYYFVYGTAVFTINLDAQVEATDINRDGVPLTLGDFTYLVAVVAGDALPYPKGPSDDTAVFRFLENDKLALEFASEDTIGAIQIVVADSVEPKLEYPDIDMLYHYNGSETKILLYSLKEYRLLPGWLLSNLDGHEIIEINAATAAGQHVFTTISDDATSGSAGKLLPTDYALYQNYPNPFNPSTTIRFDLPTASRVTFEVFNILGKTVYEYDHYYRAGTHEIIWAGVDNAGQHVASGVYYYRIETGSFGQARKMILLK